DALIEDMRSASSRTVLLDNTAMYKYGAVFGRINYNWREKYVVNITGRRDGSSRFGPGKQFANFGALGAAWVFSNEGFMSDYLSLLSFGKLRASYGSSGNDQIGDYEYLDTFTSGPTYGGSSGLRPTRLFNPDYAWEVNKKFEAALELGFLQDRLFLGVS